MRELHDGFDDKLIPVKPLDLSKVSNFSDLLEAMQYAAAGARNVGTAAAILTEMAKDKDCFVVLTLSGAMTMFKMGLVICDLIDHGLVHCVVSTGALMCHGLVEATGRHHFRYDHRMDDNTLYERGYNRVHDTLEPEMNLDELEHVISGVLHSEPKDRTWSSSFFCKKVGEYLHNHIPGRGILKSAYEHNVPIFIPAFTDSELAIDMERWAREVHNDYSLDTLADKISIADLPNFNPFLDLRYYTNLISQQKSIGIFTIGGGVPRNWAQQVGPMIELLQRSNKIVATKKQFRYAVRICTAVEQDGGLSGCTYSEGKSWGKFEPRAKTSEIWADATLVLPLLIKGVLQRLGKC
ncbi:MAG: deoxyhypusine synthase family protein [Deltaproteobacteria bacterium]|nr:deoxyhypusine synthase family protein [Deltaproteobacteria bacterium]